VIERPYPLAAEELGLVVEARPTPTEPEPKPAQPGHGRTKSGLIVNCVNVNP